MAGVRFATLCVALIGVLSACETADPSLIPDARLQSELGLVETDRVHTVGISTGVGERASPDSLSIAPGEFVQFVSGDWLVHEMAFELDSLDGELRAFLERTGQAASPPLLQRDSRFVLSFVGAPPGRYPYALAGNRESGRGVIVVAAQAPR
jgi:plastocyanin